MKTLTRILTVVLVMAWANTGLASGDHNILNNTAVNMAAAADQLTELLKDGPRTWHRVQSIAFKKYLSNSRGALHIAKYKKYVDVGRDGVDYNCIAKMAVKNGNAKVLSNKCTRIVYPSYGNDR